jgi:hypothetical protein
MRRAEARKLKFRALFACLVVAVASVATWRGGNGVPSITTLIPTLAGTVVARNPESPSVPVFVLAFVAQWFFIGFLLAMPLSILADDHPRRPIE